MQGVKSSRPMQVDVIEMSGRNISSKFLKGGEEGVVTITDNAMNQVTDRCSVREMVNKTLKKLNASNGITSTTKLSDGSTPLGNIFINLGCSCSDSKKSLFQCSSVSIVNKTECIAKSCKHNAGSTRIAIIIFIRRND